MKTIQITVSNSWLFRLMMETAKSGELALYRPDPLNEIIEGLKGIPTNARGWYCPDDLMRLIAEVRAKCEVK